MNDRNKFLYLFALVQLFGIIFVSAALNIPIIGLFISCGLIVIINFQLIPMKDSRIPKIIISLLVFQNLLIGIGAHLGNNRSESLSYLTQVPFMAIAITGTMILFFEFIKKKPRMKFYFDKWFFIFFILIITSFVISDASLESKLINIRNLSTFYFALIIGKHCLSNSDKFKSFCWFFIKLSTFVVIVGIFLYFQSYSFWKSIGIEEVYIAKKAPLLDGQFDGRFYTVLVDSAFKRMASIYYEPVNMGYLLSAAFLVAIFSKWKSKLNKFVFSFILLIGQILTFGKGSYLITMGVIGSVIIEKTLTKIDSRLGRIRLHKFIIFTSIVGISIFAVIYYKYIGGTAKQHFWGIIGTFNSVLSEPLGYGLGSGGNAAILFGDVHRENWLSSGGETAFMSFTYQLGIPFMLILIKCFSNMTTSVYRSDISKINEFKGIQKMLKYIPFMLLTMSLFQDNTFTPQCITIFMLLVGGISGCSETNKIRNTKPLAKTA